MKKIILIFALFCVIGLAPPAYSEVLHKIISNFSGEQLMYLYNFADDFDKSFRGYSIGGQSRNYFLGICGSEQKSEIIEINFCPMFGPPHNPKNHPKNPKEGVITICVVSTDFKNRNEINRAARFAAAAAFYTIAAYDRFSSFP